MGRKIWFFCVCVFMFQSAQAQNEGMKGIHVFSDTTFVNDSLTLGWTQPDSLYDGLRAVVYFHDAVEYFLYQDSAWVRVLDSIPDICVAKVSSYSELRSLDPGITCQIVFVHDFSDTVQSVIYPIKGGFFVKDTLGVEDRGTVIASDSVGVLYKRMHNGEILPDWWEGLKDSKKIQTAVNYAGNGGKVIFLPREYILDDEILLDTFQHLHLDGRKATLKGANGIHRNATLSSPYSQGDYQIQVNHVPSGWEPGDILVMVVDSTNEGTSGRSQIDSISGNVVYLKYYFSSQLGGLFPSQSQGVSVIKSLNLIRGLPSASEGVFGEAGFNQGTIIENFIFDGNKDNGNEVSLSWAVNSIATLHGRGAEISSCKFINAPSEIITGHGINVHDNVFENCNGSVYHLSAHDSTFNMSYPAYFVNNTVINCNTTPYLVSGHNEGLISFSWNGGYIIVNGNYLVAGSSSNGVIGSLTGFMNGDHDREIVILSGNYCKGFPYIVYGSHQETTHSLMITGNIFDDCLSLAPNPVMNTSVKICGNVQVGSTNFGVDFRNSCEYGEMLDRSLGYGKNALLNTNQLHNTAFGNYALESTSTGDLNTAIGNNSGQKNVGGNKNTYLGTWTGGNMVSGNDNTVVGYWARGSASSAGGDKNVHIGSEAGRTNNGDGNIFIGYSAGRYMTGSNQLVIHNNESNSPMIYGNFVDRQLTINGSLSIEGASLFRLPRITSGQRDDLIGLIGGEMIFNTSLSSIQVYDGGQWINFP